MSDDSQIEPYYDWEVCARRCGLLTHLYQALQIEPCVLRVAKQVDEKIRTRHRSVLPTYEHLAASLERWEFAGPSRHKDQLFEIMVRGQDMRFVVIVIGYDKAGRMNLATMYSPRQSSAAHRANGLIQRGKSED